MEPTGESITLQQVQAAFRCTVARCVPPFVLWTMKKMFNPENARRVETNALRRQILVALAHATHPCHSGHIRQSIPHKNELSLYSALQPMARQGLIRVVGREPVNARSKLTRPLYVISEKGHAWLKRNPVKPPKPGRAPGPLPKHNDSELAVLLKMRWP